MSYITKNFTDENSAQQTIELLQREKNAFEPDEDESQGQFFSKDIENQKIFYSIKRVTYIIKINDQFWCNFIKTKRTFIVTKEWFKKNQKFCGCAGCNGSNVKCSIKDLKFDYKTLITLLERKKQNTYSQKHNFYHSKKGIFLVIIPFILVLFLMKNIS